MVRDIVHTPVKDQTAAHALRDLLAVQALDAAGALSRQGELKNLIEQDDSEAVVNAAITNLQHGWNLVANGQFRPPSRGSGTGHLRGPRGGMIMIGEDFDNPFGLTLKSGKLKKMSTLIKSHCNPIICFTF